MRIGAFEEICKKAPPKIHFSRLLKVVFKITLLKIDLGVVF
jgi:hypothetical protein